MRHLCVAGPCEVRLDNAGVLHANCVLALAGDVAVATGMAGAYAYQLDMAPGELGRVCARDGAVVRLGGAPCLADSLRLEAATGGRVVIGAERLFVSFDVDVCGAGSCVTADNRAFVRALRAVLRNDARITDMFVADSASVCSDDARRAYAGLYLRDSTHCDGNGVRVVDVAMHNRRVAAWIAASAS